MPLGTVESGAGRGFCIINELFKDIKFGGEKHEGLEVQPIALIALGD